MQLNIDSSRGGNGDIWMRLVSFYSVAALVPETKIGILIPAFLRNLTNYTFGDRITILTESDLIHLTYTSLGLKNLIGGIAQGKKYIAPYQKAVINDKKTKQLKDVLNNGLFDIANTLGLIQVPPARYIAGYQGFLDIIGIKKLAAVQYHQYVQQLIADHTAVSRRLQATLPTSPQLVLPADLSTSVVVFPTGTSRQFVPVWWAAQHLPNAYYAFFYKDADALPFEDHGLKTIKFYHEPGDIIHLSHQANYTITTDSFPSHLLQYATSRCTVTITEVLKSRIISPAFKGTVVNATAPCHPCLHLDRKNHPLCAAGHAECINWKNSQYTQQILASIPRQVFA